MYQDDTWIAGKIEGLGNTQIMTANNEASVLKDLYVSKLVDQLKTNANLPVNLEGSLGMERAQMASVIQDLATGKTYEINDGIPKLSIIDSENNLARSGEVSTFEYPVRDEHNRPMVDRQYRINTPVGGLFPVENPNVYDVTGNSGRNAGYSAERLYKPDYWMHQNERIYSDGLGPQRSINDYERSIIDGNHSFKKVDGYHKPSYWD